MSRIKLLFLQLLVAVVAIALWHVLTTVPFFDAPILPPFFFSTPENVARRIVKLVLRGHDLAPSLDHARRVGARLRHRGRSRAF